MRVAFAPRWEYSNAAFWLKGVPAALRNGHPGGMGELAVTYQKKSRECNQPFDRTILGKGQRSVLQLDPSGTALRSGRCTKDGCSRYLLQGELPKWNGKLSMVSGFRLSTTPDKSNPSIFLSCLQFVPI